MLYSENFHSACKLSPGKLSVEYFSIPCELLLKIRISDVCLVVCLFVFCFFGQDLMSHVESFQSEAQKVLQEPTADVARLEQLLDTGITLDVDLPELPKLKQVRRKLSPGLHVYNVCVQRFNIPWRALAFACESQINSL